MEQKKVKEDKEKLDRANKKLMEFKVKMVLEENYVMMPVYPEFFMDEVKYRLGQFRFYEARPEDKKWAKEESAKFDKK
jgi:hypothetical protein